MNHWSVVYHKPPVVTDHSERIEFAYLCQMSFYSSQVCTKYQSSILCNSRKDQPQLDRVGKVELSFILLKCTAAPPAVRYTRLNYLSVKKKLNKNKNKQRWWVIHSDNDNNILSSDNLWPHPSLCAVWVAVSTPRSPAAGVGVFIWWLARGPDVRRATWRVSAFQETQWKQSTKYVPLSDNTAGLVVIQPDKFSNPVLSMLLYFTSPEKGERRYKTEKVTGWTICLSHAKWGQLETN